MIEKGARAFGHCNRLVNLGAMRVVGLQDIRAIVLQQNIFAVLDVAPGLAIRDLFNSAP